MPTLKPFANAAASKGIAATLGPKVKEISGRDRERIFFLMAMMLKTGQTTSDSLRAVAKAFKSEGEENISNALNSLAGRVAQGKMLSKAMEAEYVMFTDIHRAAIMAGEASNNMQKSFDVLRVLEDKKIQSSRSGFAEIITPLIMMVLSMISIFNTGLNTLPIMAKLREAQGKPLGAIPQGIMSTTEVLADLWFFFAAAIIIILIVFFSMKNTPQGKLTIHKYILSIPIYGRFIAYRTYTNMLLYFPYMIASGVKPKQMIPIMEALATNVILKKRIDSFNHVITTGGQMSDAMRRAGFPEIAVTPVSVSENYVSRDGNVNDVMIEGMEHAYGILERMLDDTHKKFITVFSSLLWALGAMIMLLDMMSIVLSQA